MKALVFEKIGPPSDVLKLLDIEKPILDDYKVLVKTIYSVINPADILFISGKYRKSPSTPQIAGISGVGKITEIGSLVKGHKVGDIVSFRTLGAWAEHCLVDQKLLYKVPKGISLKNAAQFSLNPLTAYGLLDSAQRFINNSQKNNYLALFTSPHTSISKSCIKLSTLFGIKSHVFFEKNNEFFLKDIECNKIIFSGKKTDEILKKSLRCYDFIFDSLGGHYFPFLLNLLNNRGAYLSYGFFYNENFSITSEQIIYKNATIFGFGIDHWLETLTKEKLDSILPCIWDHLKNDDDFPVDNIYSLSEFKIALQRTEYDAIKGKVLISMLE